jgi:hypothetical protein
MIVMKRDIYEFFKKNPEVWFTVDDVAVSFKITRERARDAISRAKSSYNLIECAWQKDRPFYRFDTERYNKIA